MKNLILVLIGTLIFVGCSASSRGRGTETTNEEVTTATDTAGIASDLEQIEDLKFTNYGGTEIPTGSSVAATTKIYIKSATPDVNIKYTIDGSEPSETAGLTYDESAGFSISQDATVKAIAFKDGMKASEVISASYTLAASNQMLTPLFNPMPDAQGFVGTGTVVKFSRQVNTVAGAIHCCMNCADPTTSTTYGTACSNGFTVSANATLKAVDVPAGAAAATHIPSAIRTVAYKVTNRLPDPTPLCTTSPSSSVACSATAGNCPFFLAVSVPAGTTMYYTYSTSNTPPDPTTSSTKYTTASNARILGMIPQAQQASATDATEVSIAVKAFSTTGVVPPSNVVHVTCHVKTASGGATLQL